MSFDVAGEAYDRLVGRWSRRLAPAFLDFAGVDGDPFTLRSRALSVRGVR